MSAWQRELLLVILVVQGGVLLVLVLSDQVADVLVGLLELHLVHTLALVPVEERLPLVHSAELGGQALEDALERGGVRDEGAAPLGVLRGNLDNGGLHVVGDPLDEVVAVGGLALLGVLINFLGGHGSTEDEGGGHVLAIVGLDVGVEVTGGVALVNELLDVDESVFAVV